MSTVPTLSRALFLHAEICRSLLRDGRICPFVRENVLLLMQHGPFEQKYLDEPR